MRPTSHDFGANWLDRLELMIQIEDRFPAVEFTDDDVDQIDVVGDLIRHIKRAWVAKRDDAPIIDARQWRGSNDPGTRTMGGWRL